MGVLLCKTLTVSWHVFFSCTNTHCFGGTVIEKIGAWVKAHVVWALVGLSVTTEGSQASWGYCTECALEVPLAAAPRVGWVFISQPSPPTWKNRAVGWESLKPDVLGAGHWTSHWQQLSPHLVLWKERAASRWPDRAHVGDQQPETSKPVVQPQLFQWYSLHSCLSAAKSLSAECVAKWSRRLFTEVAWLRHKVYTSTFYMCDLVGGWPSPAQFSCLL